MDSIHVCGGHPLNGECVIQGSKNAVLPVLAATVLIPGISVIHGCPRIADVFYMGKLLTSIGCLVRWEENTLIVDAGGITKASLPAEYVTRMRSSVIMMGAVLGRLGEAKLAYPGGCVIGERPIDMHLAALTQMGVTLTEKDDVLTAQAENLTGSEITLPFPSVGATENVLLAAVLAKGVTHIKNAAKEPEIKALCEFLKKAGARIQEGPGKNSLFVEGVASLKGCVYQVPADRIVAGTYLFSCMAAGGEIFLKKAPAEQLQEVLTLLQRMGGEVREETAGIFLKSKGRPKAVPYVKTEVYPGFPTDLQSPLLAALSLSAGESVIEEAIFENRFKIVEELNRMGADITVTKNRALIRGKDRLQGTLVTARELRGGAALVLAGLAAQGITQVQGRHFIDRGYEDIQKDLRCLGGRI